MVLNTSGRENYILIWFKYLHPFVARRSYHLMVGILVK